MGEKVSVIVATRNDTLEQVQELLTVARAVSGEAVELWLYGEDISLFMKLPVQTILFVSDKGEVTVDRFLPSIQRRINERNYTFLLTRSNFFGDELAARLGCIWNACCSTAITGIMPSQDGIHITRRTFGMQVEEERIYQKAPFFFSVSRNCFAPNKELGKPLLQFVDEVLEAPKWYTNYQDKTEESEQSLESYPIILVGGRGLGSSQEAQKLEHLGELLGAGVGATRPAALNGWFSTSRMLGISGNTISPSVCMIFGASGCLPFMKGVEKSAKLIAINQDPEALIFKYCDIGLVDDCCQIIEKLIEIYEENTP